MTRISLLLLCAALLPMEAIAATPMTGEPQVLGHGLFAEFQLGAIASLGGADQQGATGFSNPQVYYQIGLGYDLTSDLSVVAGLGLGASELSCFAGTACYATGGARTPAANFSATMFRLEGVYHYRLSERFSLRPQAGVGYALLSPAPKYDATGKALDHGMLLGAGLGVDYATHMDHLSLGVSLAFHYILGPNIPVASFSPVIRYTF